jgi:acyl-CoA dehydrogenase
MKRTPGGSGVWSFETDPEFQASLDWIDEFTREEIEPLDLVFREPGDPWDPNSPAFAAMAPLREIVKAETTLGMPFGA